MISELLKELLFSLKSETITDLFVVVMLVFFTLAFLLRLIGRQQVFVEQTPSLLTTLGILGTFTGIIIGLFEFQVSEIDGSVGALLDGLKMAFITSVVGMFLAVIFRITGYFWNPIERNKEQEASAKDILDIMVLQHQATKQLERSVLDRKEQSELFQNELLQQLHLFTQGLAEATTKEIVGALEKVVANYNGHIKSQLGENFAKLDSSITALLEWQGQNRSQMTELVGAFAEGSKAISTIDQSLSSVSEKLETYPETMARLDVALQSNQDQVEQLSEQLKVYQQIGEQAAAAIPNFGDTLENTKQQITQISELIAAEIGTAVTDIDRVLSGGAEHLSQNIKQLSELANHSGSGIEQLSENLREQLEQSFGVMAAHFNHSIRSLSEVSEQLAKEINALSIDFQSIARFDQSQVQTVIERSEQFFAASMEELVSQQQKHGERLLQQMEQSIAASIERSDSSLEHQLMKIETVMSSEIEEVLRSMGSALATISGQFTSDYQLLIKQMRRVLDASVEQVA